MASGACITFLLLFLTARVTNAVSRVALSLEPSVSASKGAYYYPLGTSVNLTCNFLEDGSLNTNDLHLAHNFKQLLNNVITIINSTTVVYSIPAANFSDRGSYFCCIRFCPSLNGLVTSPPTDFENVTLEFEDKIPEPAMKCVLSTQSLQLQCTWVIPAIRKISPVLKTNWKLNCTNEDGTKYHKCPCSTNSLVEARSNDNTSITCKLEVLLRHMYYFELTGYNDLQNVSRNYHVFTGPEIEKQPPVEGLTLNQTCNTIAVSWEMKNPFIISALYRVSYRRLQDTTTTEIFTTKSPVVIQDLIPFSEYIVTVRNKRNKSQYCSDPVYWSDPVSRSITTDEDVPRAGPAVTSGLFSRSTTEKQKVFFFWKTIPEDDRNGIITGYSITIHSISSTTPDDTVYISGGNSVTGSVWIRDISTSYNVTIRGRTKVGFSKTGSTLLVPSEVPQPDLSRQPEWVVVENNDTTYIVNWKRVKGSTEFEYLLMWCLSSYFLQPECKSSLNWVNLPGNTTMHTIKLTQRQPIGLQWIFGVATVVGGRSTGTTTSHCVFALDGGASKPARLAVQEIGAGSVRVKWVFSYCDTTVVQGRPLQYIIYYKKIQDGGDYGCESGLSKTVEVHFNTSSVDLDHLEIPGTYNLCMQIRTKAGESPYSDPTIISLELSESSLAAILGVSISFVSVVLIILICCFRHRKRFKMCRKHKIDLQCLEDEIHKEIVKGFIEGPFTDTRGKQEADHRVDAVPAVKGQMKTTNNVLAMANGSCVKQAAPKIISEDNLLVENGSAKSGTPYLQRKNTHSFEVLNNTDTPNNSDYIHNASATILAIQPESGSQHKDQAGAEYVNSSVQKKEQSGQDYTSADPYSIVTLPGNNDNIEGNGGTHLQGETTLTNLLNNPVFPDPKERTSPQSSGDRMEISKTKSNVFELQNVWSKLSHDALFDGNTGDTTSSMDYLPHVTGTCVHVSSDKFDLPRLNEDNSDTPAGSVVTFHASASSEQNQLTNSYISHQDPKVTLEDGQYIDNPQVPGMYVAHPQLNTYYIKECSVSESNDAEIQQSGYIGHYIFPTVQCENTYANTCSSGNNSELSYSVFTIESNSNSV